MNWDPKHPRVPVDKDGNWLAYPEHWRMKDGGGWEEVPLRFWAVLRVTGMETGRSAKRVLVQDAVSEKKYPMFVADLVKAIQEEKVTVRAGRLYGFWSPSKRGANYGIKAVSGE